MAWNAKYLHCAVSNPGNGAAIWTYRDTATPAALDTAAYMADAGKYGMRLGDVLIYTQVDDQENPTSVTKQHITFVNAVTAATGAIDVADGTAIDETDTD